MSLRHLYRDINSLGIYSDLVYGHLSLSGVEDVKIGNIICKNKYYGYKVHIYNNTGSKYNMNDKLVIHAMVCDRGIDCTSGHNKIWIIRLPRSLYAIEIDGVITNLNIPNITINMIYEKYFIPENNDILLPLDIVDRLKKDYNATEV